MKRKLLAGLCLATLLSSFVRRDAPIHCIYTDSVAELHEFLRRTPDRIPLISAHRGGPAPGFPENCIPTFEHTLAQTYAAIEFDVQLSADDSLVVMHDDRLDRTTNGTGYVHEHTYGQLRQLRLEDNAGNATAYSIPTLAGVLHWAKGKTILTLDPKRSVPSERIAAAIREAGAEAYTVVITYTADNAALYHQLNPDLVLSVNVKHPADLGRLESLGVPPNRMLAFVGVAEPDAALYRLLHEKGIYCSLGTMGNLDRMAEARGEAVYGELIKRGADMLSTDRPEVVARAFIPLIPKKSSKKRFFKEQGALGNK
jgi:glycerophosphoryl diester phosphodiesterase